MNEHLWQGDKLALHEIIKGAVSRYSVIFCALLREQKMAVACASVADISSVSRVNSFTAQTESSKCRFLRLLPSGRHYFPHTKWLPKINDYRATAALNISLQIFFLLP